MEAEPKKFMFTLNMKTYNHLSREQGYTIA